MSDSAGKWSANPVWWKTNLLAHGAVWENDFAREELVTLTLPGLREGAEYLCTFMTGVHPQGRSLRLQRRDHDRVLVKMDDFQIEAALRSESETLAGNLSTGVPIAASIYPTGSWIATGIRAEGKVRTPLMSYDELDEALRVADRSRTIRGLMLAPPAVDRRTGGIGLLEPYITRLKSRGRHRVMVEIDPPADLSWIERAYSWGADGVFIPLRPVHTEAGLQDHQVRALEALHFAAGVFPAGAVATSFNPGAGSLDETTRLARQLMGQQVLPLLYYPVAMGDQASFDVHVRMLAEGLLQGSHLSDRYWFGLGHLLSPLDMISLLEGATAHNLADKVFRSPIGDKLLNLTSNLRRSLRVIPDPNQSGGEGH